jgi:hypothetical protein
MHYNPATRQGKAKPSLRPVGSPGKGVLRLISNSEKQQADPNRDNVVSMLRHGVGSVLDGLSEAQAKVRDARRLHEIALSLGDEQVAAMLGHELGRVAAATRITGSEPDQPAPQGAKND